MYCLVLHRSHRRSLVAFAILALLHGGIQLPLSAQEFEPGARIERALNPGETHSYRFRLLAGDCLQILLDQHDADMAVRLTAPDGREIAAVDVAEQGPEPVTVAALATGFHHLRVQAVKKAVAPRCYRIRVLARRKMIPADRDRIQAQRAATAAKRAADLASAASFPKALEGFQKALSLWRAAADPVGEAQALNGIARVFWAQGENAKAVEPLSHAAAAWRAAGESSGEAAALDLSGMVLDNLGEKKRALESYAEALTLRQAAHDRWGEGQTLNNIGAVYNALGEKEKALEYFERALEIFRAGQYRLDESSTLSNIGGVHDGLGNKRKALGYFLESLRLARAEADRRSEAYALHNAGGIYHDLGEDQKALELFARALPLFQAVGDRMGEAYALTLLGTVYDDLGDSHRALDYYLRTLRLARELQDRPAEAMALNDIGYAYDALGDPQKAARSYSEALKLGESLNDGGIVAYASNNLGRIHQDWGEKEKAIVFFQQAISSSRRVGDARPEAIALRNLGTVYASLRDKEKARDHLREARALSRRTEARHIEAGTLYSLARFERDQGNFAEAQKCVEDALAIVESLRLRVAARDLRSSYLASVKDYFDLDIDLRMALHQRQPGAGHDAAALYSSERSRARTLLEALSEAHIDFREGVDAGLVERERTLQQQINIAAQRQSSLLAGKYSETEAGAARQEVDSLLAQFRDVEGQIRAASPRYARLTQPEPLDLAGIQKEVLDQDTALVEYSLGRDRSYVWAVTASGIESSQLPARDQIEMLARPVYELLTARNRHDENETAAGRRARIATAEAEYPEAALKLSRAILSPIAGQLGRRRLLIVSEGALQYIPFGALPSPEREGQPLLAAHEVVNLPSASALMVIRRDAQERRSGQQLLAVLADPVFDTDDPRVRSHAETPARSTVAPRTRPAVRREVERSGRESGVTRTGYSFPRLQYSRREADWILPFAPLESRLAALDFRASRRIVMSPELGRYRIIHFATHGLVNNVHPELSGIVLSLVDERGRTQDGFLRLHEIYNLRLPAELVVLSACQTALGKEIRGEGLVGLTRGFMYAGAERVVASLWKVDDEATAALMRLFYQGMLEDKMGPAAALRAAQMKIQQQKRWTPPYYWGGFVLQGEWR